MQIKIQCVRLLAALVLAASASTAAIAQTENLPTTGQFWACDPGFTFQTSGNAARCIKAGQSKETNPGNCAPPSEKRIDYRGLTDACVAGPIAGDLVCFDPTTRKLVRKGMDICVKDTDPTIRQPSASITRSSR
jgi:hypothetical protein